MLIPLQWLRQYVNVDLPVEEFAHRMIMTGAEVEGWQDLSAGLEKVVVGRIDRLSPHPDSDHLLLCEIDVGTGEPLPVVTGAQNVFEGARVPVALVGANLPCGLAIKASKLRGRPSLGMLCSGEELQIHDDVYPGAAVDGILILREEWDPGTPIARVLGRDDVVVDFKTQANRPDCLSILGTAREAAVTLNLDLTPPPADYTESGGGSATDLVKVTVLAPDLCPRYMARVIGQVKIAPSPAWMQRSLLAAGVRPINNIVDITNYVMLETGQPLHAFDRRQIEGGHIIVRRAGEGETLMTLDGKDRQLTAQMLVIANQRVPMAVAGIMGGEHSGIAEDTAEVIIESACFERTSIRLTSRALGMRTESSARFEKGVPPQLAAQAMDRVMHLVNALGAGRVVPGCVDACAADLGPRVVQASAADINRLLGQNLSAQQMAAILRRLSIETTVDGDTLCCVLPFYRGDIEEMADLAEEIQRIDGYDKIPSTPLSGDVGVGRRSRRQLLEQDVRAALSGWGLYEAVTYSFHGPSEYNKLLLPAGDPLTRAAQIQNPLGEEYSLLRTTLAPGMLTCLANNQNRQIETARLFELGTTFAPRQIPLTELPDETLALGIALLDEEADFFTLKGLVEGLLARCRINDAQFGAGGPVFLHPGRRAALTLGGKPLGWLGELHPAAAENYGLDRRVLLAELTVDGLLSAAPGDTPVIRPLPRFPAVARDLAVTVAEGQPVGPMLGAIRKAAGKVLEQAGIFDVYQGKQTAPGAKSVAFSLSFRAADRTLLDDEVNVVFDAILSALSDEFGAKLRE